MRRFGTIQGKIMAAQKIMLTQTLVYLEKSH